MASAFAASTSKPVQWNPARANSVASGRPTTQPLVLRDLLGRHVISPVRWELSLRAMATNPTIIAATSEIELIEVLQEILHRYVAIDRRPAIQPAFDAILGVVDEVLAVGRADVERAKDIVLGAPRLSARDALHAAVMERERIARIMSFDAGFDGVPGLTRLGA